MEGRFEFDGTLLYYLAVSFVMLPLRWLLAWILAALFHELCHYLAIRCFGYRITNISVGLSGARIVTAPMKSSAKLISTVAGPAGSFLLLLLIRWLPRVGVCGAVQGLYNILPLNSADGGQIVLTVLSRIFHPGEVDSIFKNIRNISSLLLLFFGVFLLISELKLLPLLAVVMIIMKDRKKTLKKRSQEVTIVLP